jgi:cytochrome oxidase Cu insertion factor (SCO1/SenC/PrrC family)
MVFTSAAGMLLPVDRSDSTVDHSQQIVLVDKAGHIRGVYDGMEKDEVTRLKKEIKALMGFYKQQEENK